MSDKFGWQKATRRDAGRRALASGGFYRCKQGSKKKRKQKQKHKQHPLRRLFRPLGFGMHKGKPLTEVPRDYLEWVLENCAKLAENTQLDIRAILAGHRPHANPTPLPTKPQHKSTEAVGREYSYNPERYATAAPWHDDEPGAEGAIESRLQESEIPY
jgi:hypothetical protein